MKIRTIAGKNHSRKLYGDYSRSDPSAAGKHAAQTNSVRNRKKPITLPTFGKERPK